MLYICPIGERLTTRSDSLVRDPPSRNDGVAHALYTALAALRGLPRVAPTHEHVAGGPAHTTRSITRLQRRSCLRACAALHGVTRFLCAPSLHGGPVLRDGTAPSVSNSLLLGRALDPANAAKIAANKRIPNAKPWRGTVVGVRS